jgi:hypothetical protein
MQMSDQNQKQSTEETATQLTNEKREQDQNGGDVPTPELKVEVVENRANPVIVC